MKIVQVGGHRSNSKHIYQAVVDDIDFDAVMQFKWTPTVLKKEPPIYVFARRNDNGKTITMHQFVWSRFNGPVPQGLTLDHREHGDFGALDNRRINLRLATNRDQKGNRRTANRYKGVHWHKQAGKWAAQISINNTPKYLGLFYTEIDAALAYDTAARSAFGDFALLNFS